MNYYLAIKMAYPEIKDDQFTLQDDGQGVYLAKWAYKADKPNLSDFDTQATQIGTRETQIIRGHFAETALASSDYKILKILEAFSKDIPDALRTEREKYRTQVRVGRGEAPPSSVTSSITSA